MTEGRQRSTKSRFGHWVRVVLMFLSFGFIFPHAMTEDDDRRHEDIAKGQAGRDTNATK